MPSENVLYNNLAQDVEMIFAIEKSLEIIEELFKRGIKNEKPAEVKVKAGKGTAA